MLVIRNLSKIRVASVQAVYKHKRFAVFRQLTSLQCDKKCFSTHEITQHEAKEANWKGRVDLAAAFRGLESMGLHEGVCNHLSLVVPAANGLGDVMLMNSYGYHWREIQPELLVGLSVDQGDLVEGTGDVEISAKTIHLAIHQARPDAKCAFHVHPPYATALGMLKDLPFGMYHQNSLLFYDEFAYDQDYGGLSLDITEGQRIAKHIKDKSILFMCNHGVMVVGKTVADVFNDVYYLERACMFQTIAMSTGRELMKLSDETARETKESYGRMKSVYSSAFFDSIKRITGVNTKQ